MGWREDEVLESWLSGLIACFQNDDCRPPDSAFSNLDDLSDPTQILCLSIELVGGALLASALITHEAGLGNGVVSAFRVTDTESLAAFADQAPVGMHWQRVHTNPLFPKNWLLPTHALATIAASHLARRVRAGAQRDGPFALGGRMILQGDPAGALWDLAGTKLPAPGELLRTIGSTPAAQLTSASVDTPSPEAETPTVPARASGFATYADPLVWFGAAPFPSPGEFVGGLSTLDIAKRTPMRVVATRQVTGCELYLSSHGLVIAEGASVESAHVAINLVFAAFLLSGLPATAASPTDLLVVTEFDRATGELRGCSGQVVLRNERFSPVPMFTENFARAFQVDADVARQLVDLAASYGADPISRAMALRLLDVSTLLQRGHATEAFLIAWTIIEQWIGDRFLGTWLKLGRSKRAIKAMERDWTASQQLDLLAATRNIDQPDFELLTAMRRRRNDVVHRLQSASPDEARQAIDLAERFAGLSGIALTARHFDLH